MAVVAFWWVFIDGFLAASITGFAVRAVFYGTQPVFAGGKTYQEASHQPIARYGRTSG